MRSLYSCARLQYPNSVSIGTNIRLTEHHNLEDYKLCLKLKIEYKSYSIISIDSEKLIFKILTNSL